MKLKKKILLLLSIFFISAAGAFADVNLSTKTKDMLEDLMTLKIKLKAEENARTSLSILDNWITSTKKDFDSLTDNKYETIEFEKG